MAVREEMVTKRKVIRATRNAKKLKKSYNVRYRNESLKTWALLNYRHKVPFFACVAVAVLLRFRKVLVNLTLLIILLPSF